MSKTWLVGLFVVAWCALAAPRGAAAEEAIDLDRYLNPVCQSDSGTCSDRDAPSVAPGDEFMAQLGMPEPIPLQGDTWTEYRWVYNGCCTSVNKTKYKQQRRTCSCCYATPPMTRCGSWTDTGTTKCENLCML